MDTTIRNLDEAAYRELKARAALEGKTIGEAVNEAIRAYLAHPDPRLGLRAEEEERISEALSALGSLNDEEAERLRESVRRLRLTWR